MGNHDSYSDEVGSSRSREPTETAAMACAHPRNFSSATCRRFVRAVTLEEGTCAVGW